MASYKDPIYTTYTRSVVYTAAAAYTVSPPPGCNKCRLVDINASVSSSFVGESTAATVVVGVPSNTTVLGVLAFGTLTSPAQANAVLGWGTQVNKTGVTGSNPKVPVVDLTGASNPAGVTSPFPAAIEALGPISIGFTAPVGGSIAGAAIVDVTLAWF
jgi:hypothetical protein